MERKQKTGQKIAKPKAVTVCMSDVQPESINWLWAERIAIGKLTLISGDPGLGKSLLTATMAATVSTGGAWPLSNIPSQIGSVVLLSAEDGPADTIRPRLDAAGADCERIYVLQAIRDVDNKGNQNQHMFSLRNDLDALEELLVTLTDCRLVVIDPISAYLDGADSHNNTDVRGLLAPLAKLATDHNVAVVLVQHLNKSIGGNAMHRSMGSMAFIAAARAGYIVTKDAQNPSRRLVLPTKNNLAKEDTGLAYAVITAENGAPKIEWESEPVTMTADDALAPFESEKAKTGTDWAEDVLLAILTNGPVPVMQIRKEAREAGLSDKQLRRAGEQLCITSKKSGFAGGWVWSLPGHEGAQESEDASSESEGILGAEGHLGSKTKNPVISEPQNDGTVTVAVGSSDSVPFSDK